MTAMTDLTVIIVNWNTRELLQGCLRSIYQHTSGMSYHVIVVDNASSDGSPDIGGSGISESAAHSQRDNLGFSSANNQALRVASSRYFLLLNSDTALQENAFKHMLEFMDAHPDAGLAGTRLLNPDGSGSIPVTPFPQTIKDALR